MPPRGSSVGGQNPEFVLREFQGMNVLDARETIHDDEFFWCENAIPIAPGSVYPINTVSAALATVGGEIGAPSYSMTFNQSGTDYAFGVWSNSGAAYIVNLTTFTVTKIITSGLGSGVTAATQYNNQGLLIIDPTGYWDWNVTTASTLTPQNNAIASTTLTAAGIAPGGGQLKQILTVTGSGASFQTLYTVYSVAVSAGGTGYVVGDSLYLNQGSPITAANLIVSAVSSGAITAVTISTGGSYPGPTTSTLTATGPAGSVVTGGTGSGATFTTQIKATSTKIITRGNGYSNADTYQDQNASSSFIDQFSIVTSGVIGGQSIATYAGRVWISNNRTVYFTDINSYNAFGGAGGSFAINDAYLHNNVTALFASNNYLYIFGDTSIDALSNVTVTSGVTSFTRINVTSSVGTSTPTSIFSYYRSIVFYHSSGFYLLSGATPEKISQKISGIIQQITASGGFNAPLVYGGQVLIRGELCATLLFSFKDVFTQGGATRAILALFFRGRWWVASLGALAAVQAMLSVSIGGNATIYVWAGTSLYRAFNAASALAAWILKTKLWDAGAPLLEKQSLNAAIAANWVSGSVSGVTLTVDTELGSSGALPVPLNGSPVGYQLDPLAANQGGSQYLGLTASGSTNVSQIRMLALRGKAEHDFLQ